MEGARPLECAGSVGRGNKGGGEVEVEVWKGNETVYRGTETEEQSKFFFIRATVRGKRNSGKLKSQKLPSQQLPNQTASQPASKRPRNSTEVRENNVFTVWERKLRFIPARRSLLKQDNDT